MTTFLLLLGACTPSSGSGVDPVLEGPEFFDRPWPSDARLVDGHPDFSGFPRQGQYPLVDAYFAAAYELDGFGTNSPVYVRFAETMDTTLLPTAEESTTLDTPVMLLDVDPASPHRGERVPLQFEYWDEATHWTPEHLLAAAPVFGFPLRPATTYALVLRPPLSRAGAMGDVWGYAGDPAYTDTEDTLRGLGIDPETVSLAVPFTTQNPVAETARIADAIWDRMAPTPLGQELTLYADRSAYTLYTGHVDVPVWQWGERPYHDAGGGFLFDDDGNPLVYQWERVEFSLTIPKGEMPTAGWPVVLYAHGTGGDNFTFCQTGANDEEGTVMGRVGVAMIGISQPLHGDRSTPDTNVDLDSFNFYNPDAGRTNFRQGALDQVYLANMLTANQPSFTVDGENIRLDPGRVAYFGHSQGGLVGAIAAPFFRGKVRVAGFSGTGGGLAMTILLRKDPLDIALVMEALLGFDADEHLSVLHPVIGVVQTLVEATDPLNYAGWWFADQPAWASAPVPILLTEGLHDQATPSVTTEALAAAARVPIVGDAATDPDALLLRGLEGTPLPTSQNAMDWNGAAITAGLAQFPNQDHYAIYQDNSARRLYRDFLKTGLEDVPSLEE
jgi:hypothetical protein